MPLKSKKPLTKAAKPLPTVSIDPKAKVAAGAPLRTVQRRYPGSSTLGMR
jgi:hypothetical protein